MSEAKKPSPIWVESLASAAHTGALVVYGYRSAGNIPVTHALLPGLGYIPATKADALRAAIDREVQRGTVRVIDMAKAQDGDLVRIVRQSADEAALRKLLETTQSGTVREAIRDRAKSIESRSVDATMHALAPAM